MMFGRYLTQQVAEEILADRVALGGELRTASVLFSDIRGFTALSENMEPTELVGLLNEYLDAMVRVGGGSHGGSRSKGGQAQDSWTSALNFSNLFSSILILRDLGNFMS